MISAKEFAAQARKYIGTPYANPPAGLKCDSLVEACLSDCGYKVNWAGTNTMARTPGVFAWLGSVESCVNEFGSVPVGACPMIWANDGGEPDKYRNDGIGDYTHIGIKTGDGLGAIHASSSKGGVCESKFEDKTIPNGGWNRVGLLAMLDYGGEINRILYEVQGDFVTSQEAPLHKLAVAHSTVLMTVPAGTYVVLWEDIKGEWAHVSVDEIEGYIETKYLKEEEEQTMIGVIKSANGLNVNFRKQPSKTAAVFGSLPVGTNVEVLGTNGGWFNVCYNGNVGYIMKEFVETENVQPEQPSSELQERINDIEARLTRLEKEWESKMGWG